MVPQALIPKKTNATIPTIDRSDGGSDRHRRLHMHNRFRSRARAVSPGCAVIRSVCQSKPSCRGAQRRFKASSKMRIRKALSVVGVVLALLILVLVLVVAFFDWNLLKPTINRQVSETLGREFVIEDDLDVRWGRDRYSEGWRAWVPHPQVSAESVQLGNADWGKAPYFVRLARVEAELAPLALLGGVISIPRITLTQPSAHIERLGDGRANWNFEALENDDADKSESAWTVDIGTIGFDQGDVTYKDETLRADIALNVTPLGEPIPFSDITGDKDRKAQEDGPSTQDYVFAWNAKGTYRAQPVNGKGRIGGLLALHDANTPFPLQVDLRAGATHVVIEGTLVDPRNLGALDLRLRMSGDSLGNLHPLIGVTLPSSGPYSTDGRLRANLQRAEGATFAYEGFNGRIGQSDIHGDVSFVAGEPRPKLTGDLVSNQLLFKDLAPLIGADSDEEKAARGEKSKQPDDRALPAEPFQTDRWRDMDADVRFQGKRIVHSEQLPISDLKAHVVLDDGVVSLQPLDLGVAGGRIESRIRLDGKTTPMGGHAAINAQHVKLRELFPGVEAMQDSLGELNGQADLRGRGNSVAALLGTSNGELHLLMNDGKVSRSLMELAGLNVGNYVVSRLFGDDEVQINCAVADVGFKDGLATPRVLVIDTENAVINITGDVNLKSEALNMDIVPRSKGLRIISLRSPLYVHGTFKDPSPGVHAGPLALRGAGMVLLGAAVGPAAGLLALIAPSGEQADQCAPLLKKVKAAQ